MAVGPEGPGRQKRGLGTPESSPGLLCWPVSSVGPSAIGGRRSSAPAGGQALGGGALAQTTGRQWYVRSP